MKTLARIGWLVYSVAGVVGCNGVLGLDAGELDSDPMVASNAPPPTALDPGPRDDARSASNDPRHIVSAAYTEAGAPGFCGSHTGALLCDDFDGPLDTRWSFYGGAFIANDNDANSLPRSLSTRTAPSDGGAGVMSYAWREFAAPTRFRVGFDLRNASPSTCSLKINVGTIAFTGDNGGYFLLNLQATNAGAVQLQEYGVPSSTSPATSKGYATAGSITPGSWGRIDLEVDIDAAGPTASIVVNRLPALGPVTLTPTFPLAGKPSKLTVGIDYAKGSTAECAYRVDNVLIERL